MKKIHKEEQHILQVHAEVEGCKHTATYNLVEWAITVYGITSLSLASINKNGTSKVDGDCTRVCPNDNAISRSTAPNIDERNQIYEE